MALRVSEELGETNRPTEEARRRPSRSEDVDPCQVLEIETADEWGDFFTLPNRCELIRQLWKTPGLNVNQLRERLGVYRHTVEFHLEKLKERGLVVTYQRGKGAEILCFLARDSHLWEHEPTRILFGRASNRKIALYVSENPRARCREIAEAVGLQKVTVSHHLRALNAHGLVGYERTGNAVQYFPMPTLEAWVEDVGPCYRRPWKKGEG